MLLAFLPQVPGIAGVDLAVVIPRLLPTLGASSQGDLTWCLVDEFYQWADEYAKRLARHCGVFVERDSTTVTSSGTATYNTPARFLDAIQASIYDSGTGNYSRLRPSSIGELYALDATWPTTTGVVQRYSVNEGTITLYRIPQVTGALAVIFHQFPPTISSGGSTVAVASPVGDYFVYGMLAEARRKQGEGAMPEMAAHFDQRVAMYEKILCAYFGGGQ